MTTPRIAVLNARDEVLGFLDNDRPGAVHYFDETLHLYLAGSAYTFDGKVLTCEDTQIIEVGNKLSFRHQNKDYYLNIVKTEKDEVYTSFECFGLTFEFLNEEVDKYEAPEAKTLAAYIQQWGAETMDLRIIHNEVADRALKLKWDGRETILKRLFSLANSFDVELDFQTVLNRDFSLSHMNLYIVKQTGKDRTGEILRYGKEIEGIKKTSDVSDLYTAIRPRGKDGLTLAGYSHAKESDGCWLRGEDILNPSAKDRFPALNPDKAEGYIARYWDCDVEDQAMLYGRALAELRKNSVPKLEYEVDGFVDGAIGDRFTIEDDAYQPTLYVQARVVEQEICFTDPSRSKTTFDNFTEVKSQLSSTIQAQVEKLVEKYKTYQAGISSTAGTIFVNGVGSTTLTAYVRDGVTDVTDKFTIRWYKAGTECGNGKTLTVSSTDFDDMAVYGFKAFDSTGAIKAEYELTFANVGDGVSDYLHVKYSNDGGQTFSSPDGDWIGQYHDSNPVDSPDPARYTWAKIKGNDGANGQTQKLVSLTNEYYLSTSDTAQTGGSWGTAYPDYEDGKFLWVRIKAVYKDPNGTAYTTPELEKAWLNAGKAIQKAQTAADSASAASSAAAAAVSQAQAAKATADSVAAEIAPIKTGVQEAKDAAADAKKEIADKTQQMLLDIGDTYATKNEVTTLEGDLQAQITANATEIASKVSQTEYQQNQQDIDDTLASLNSDLTAAQGTLSSLQSSQSEAAQKLAQAEQDLRDAQDAVSDLQASQTATDTQLKAAQDAVTKAQAAVDKAQSDVDKANTEIGKVKTDIAGIQGDISDLTSRVTTAETSITQNANAIALRATKTEVNTAVQGAKDYADSKITVKANEITSSVTAVQNRVNGLQQQKVDYFYYLSTSPDSCTGGSWSTTKPAETAGKYIWFKQRTTYVSGASTESSPARLTGKDGADGHNGADTLSISITQSWDDNQCTLTAHVFKGPQELTDVQVIALGALKWYKDGTFLSNGKQLTRTLTGRETIECRLESGGGVLMPEFITLADGSLAVKGRNLLKQSCPLVVGNWINNGGSPAIDNAVLYDGKPTLRLNLGAGIVYYPIPRATQTNNVEDWVPMIVGQTYVYSMCLKAEGTVNHALYVPLHWHFKNTAGDPNGNQEFILNGGTITVGEWSVIWTKFKTIHKWMRPFIYTGQNPAVPVNIAWIKLEYGDEFTGPSAAPEDEEVTT
ncbi:phage tail spike protein [Faecalibaculum rodentium]|uniref:phage tail spike protein n=1 Tax=Faecalibaculum rodentium TaxID=1702221 RepID=UPI0025A0C4C7|nr:phage tail spike protein [Faecalibaculum rodentium]